ncbi:MAG TPA: ABC transporter permease subunit [Thermoanaerobaculia bacterium]|nr:ABC transporter permease subunit [Thermoanaerobaculia bacterium]HQP84991.1 ABC transporter permease subunit [Thermoanaerobaculia bacterium]
MTVRARRFRPFEGTPTSTLTRLLVLPRYAWKEAFQAKLVTGAFTASFLAPVGALVLVWLKHNIAALANTPLAGGIPLPIDEKFFGWLLVTQSYFAFALTLFVGPSLVSPDLVNGALPLYFSRPLSRWQYVLGKLLVLAALLSAITWVPLLVVFVLQASLAEGAWIAEHAGIAGSILLGSLLLVLFLSLASMAVSAWVRNRAVARGLLIGLGIVPAVFGQALNGILDVEWGGVLNLGLAWGRVLEGLFGIPVRAGIPLGGAWASLLTATALSLLLLRRKLRAFEVVR